VRAALHIVARVVLGAVAGVTARAVAAAAGAAAMRAAVDFPWVVAWVTSKRRAVVENLRQLFISIIKYALAIWRTECLDKCHMIGLDNTVTWQIQSKPKSEVEQSHSRIVSLQ
jgi:hypothetical protein